LTGISAQSDPKFEQNLQQHWKTFEDSQELDDLCKILVPKRSHVTKLSIDRRALQVIKFTLDEEK